MIPTVMRLRIKSPEFGLRLWIPLFIVWLLLLPLLVLLVPFLVAIELVMRIGGWRYPVFRALALVVELIASLRKTEIHVHSSSSRTRVDISIL